jgi:hypothetical protein
VIFGGKYEMDYKRLAELVRQFDNTDLLAYEIETLIDDQDVETIDELSNFLRDELDYSCQ